MNKARFERLRGPGTRTDIKSGQASPFPQDTMTLNDHLNNLDKLRRRQIMQSMNTGLPHVPCQPKHHVLGSASAHVPAEARPPFLSQVHRGTSHAAHQPRRRTQEHKEHSTSMLVRDQCGSCSDDAEGLRAAQDLDPSRPPSSPRDVAQAALPRQRIEGQRQPRWHTCGGQQCAQQQQQAHAQPATGRPTMRAGCNDG